MRKKNTNEMSAGVGYEVAHSSAATPEFPSIQTVHGLPSYTLENSQKYKEEKLTGYTDGGCDLLRCSKWVVE